MARSDYTDDQRRHQRVRLADELFSYMDMHEISGEGRSYEQFEYAVDRLMEILDREVNAAVGEGTPARIVQKLREGVL